MAITYTGLGVLVGIILTLGRDVSAQTCGEKLTACMNMVHTSPRKGADVEAMCENSKLAMNCLQNAKTTCSGRLKGTVDISIGDIKQKWEENCATTGVTSGVPTSGSGLGSVTSSEIGGDQLAKNKCRTSEYRACLEKATEHDHCPAFRCVQQLKAKCRGKGYEDVSDAIKDRYKELKEKCGCSILEPSSLLLLTMTFTLTLRYYV